MNRPRPLLRSLVAATCGSTLLAAAVLGTGAAAFAEEPAEGDASAVSLMTTESSATQEDQEDTAGAPASPDASDAVDDAASTTDELSAEQPAADPSPATDTSAGDALPADAATDAPSTPPTAEPSVPAQDAPAEPRVAPLTAMVLPEAADPQIAVTVPRSVGLGGTLGDITFTAVGEAEPVVQLTLSAATADMIDSLDFQALEAGGWADIPFERTESGLAYTFPVRGGEVKLRVGVSPENYERQWKLFLEEQGLLALAEEDGPEPIDFIDFTTELVDVPGDSQRQEHSIALVAPEIRLIEGAPEEADAGDSFSFSYRITNRTGSGYPASASVALFQSAWLLVDDELYPVDEADMVMTCSIDGGHPVEVDLDEFEHPIAGPGGALALGELASGAVVDVHCGVDLADDLPDSELAFIPMLTLGESRAPLAIDEDAVQFISIFEVSEPAPAPEPAQPEPAQPAPVRPTPRTPSNPPAAAPVRQVPTTEPPRTGTDPLPLAAAGVGLVLAGASVLLGGRRRAHN